MRFNNILCFFGIHKYDNEVRFDGAPNRKVTGDHQLEIPVRIVELCVRCNKKRRWIEGSVGIPTNFNIKNKK